MIAKIVQGGDFKGAVGYVLGKSGARLIDACEVRGRSIEDMDSIVDSFVIQARLNPRISKPVAHISLDFSAQDKDKLTDEVMRKIAREYIDRMGYGNTQYIMVRHTDTDHPHLHLVLNRIDNDGKRITDQNERLRSTAICRELTERHGLYIASGKENVKEHRLREPDKTRYEIYNTLRVVVPRCRSWPELTHTLERQGIGVELIRNGDTDKIQGFKFSKSGYHFNGSKVDRQFSYSKIDWQLRQNVRTGLTPTQKPEAPKYYPQAKGELQKAVGSYLSAFGKCFPTSGKDSGGMDLSALGADSLPLPSIDLGIGISQAELQRQPDETPEHHIARITALINRVAAAMLSHAEEQKRKQEQQSKQVKRPKIKF